MFIFEIYYQLVDVKKLICMKIAIIIKIHDIKRKGSWFEVIISLKSICLLFFDFGHPY